MPLRDYQQRSIDELYLWLKSNDGNPCLVLPTGAGKSHVVAEFCKSAVQQWPQTRILMLTHVKELIEQNAEKLRGVWPNAPLALYSAGLKRKDVDAITFGGIQSLRTKASTLGHVDIVIVDECHLINNKQEGGYRQLIDDLTAINPYLRVIGLTATPYRLGQGYITNGESIFTDLIEPVSIAELVTDGYLAPLRSKLTEAHLDTSGVKKRGGEFIESQLQAAVDTDPINQAVVDEVIQLSGDRKAWLFFCSGVDHAIHVCDALKARGIVAECITGKTPKTERDQIIDDYKAGRIQALTNANVLTTGFDYPDIDLIAMLRPTMSPGLYVQMAGRGMRLKSHADHCLVLDFAGVVEQHGPITYVQPPKDMGSREGTGEAPVKSCDECHELVHPTAKVCPACGFEFPPPEKADLTLHNDDIMSMSGSVMQITSWRWIKHISRSSGREMVKTTYNGPYTQRPVHEYLPVAHGGYAGQKAVATVMSLADSAGCDISQCNNIDLLCDAMSNSVPPTSIEYRKDGKFNRIIKRDWSNS
jgi:DNA repair protein RadD